MTYSIKVYSEGKGAEKSKVKVLTYPTKGSANEGYEEVLKRYFRIDESKRDRGLTMELLNEDTGKVCRYCTFA